MKYSVLIGGYFSNLEFNNKQRAINYARIQAKFQKRLYKNAYWSVYDSEGYEVATGRA